MAGGPVIIIIGPHPNRVVSPEEEQSPPSTTLENRIISIKGLYADPTNGEVMDALQEAMDTMANTDPDDPWTGS